MFKKIVLGIISFYFLLLTGFYFFQENIIFRPKLLDKNYHYTFEHSFKEINLKAEDGASVNALYFKVKSPKGVILYFHGNKGNLQRWGKIASKFTTDGYDVFVIDYRGYGKTKGERNEKKLYDDADLSYYYLKQIYEESKISIYGRSLGTTFAVYVASLHNPKQLILEAPFYSLTNLVSRKFYLFPFKYLLAYNFPSYKFITNVNCPITIFHGNMDRLIPIKEGKKLFNDSDKKRSTFIRIEKGNHHNLNTFKKYKENIKLLLN
jgi:hypothetical protein